jgi:hypothetical protein
MDIHNQKYKLVVAVSLLTAETDRIKKIFTSYNIRLDCIYNKLVNLIHELDELNKIEQISDDKTKIDSLIEYVHLMTTNDIINNTKNIGTNNFTNISKQNEILKSQVNTNFNSYNNIQLACSASLLKDQQEQIIAENEDNSSTDSTEDETKPNNNNTQQILDNKTTQHGNTSAEIKKKKRDLFNAKRRQQRIEFNKHKQETDGNNNIILKF